MQIQISFIILMLVLPAHFNGIKRSSDPKEEPKPPNIIEEETLSPASTSYINVTERQRRLIPYMTFYLTQNRPSNHIQEVQEPAPHQYRIVPQKITVQPFPGKIILVNQVNTPKYPEPNPVIYQPKVRYTPFLESNKLPGGFTPMRNPNQQSIRVQVLNPQVQQTQSFVKQPNYSTIFDNLLQLKQLQYTKAPQYETVPQYQNPKNIATQYYTRNYVTPRPSKYITVEDFQAENYKQVTPTKTYIHTYTPANIDISNENKVQNYEHFEPVKTYNQIPSPVPAKELAVQQPEQIHEEKNYEPIIFHPIYRPVQVPVPVPVPVNTYRPAYQATEPTTQAYASTENPHSLNVILKQLQDSNTLPQTLTPDNIDNSIKTLVQILNALKHTQKFQRPIIVTQDSTEPHPEENIDDYDDSILPETVSHSYPANTPEGGTPGKPGVDYPAYSFIPQTNFNCKKQRYKGFFGDPDTNCQVWHYCDLNGGQASFLCPNGTIFSQVALTCDWWYNVKCATTTQLYVLNERLYKYILPFTPKFPEDYSGPLVDRYLALKFKEMEEKMKKQKKGKTEKPADDVQEVEVNKLEDIEENSDVESVAESQDHTTKTSQENKNSR